MNIGITQRVMENKIWGKYDALEQNYVKYFSRFGINVIPIPNTLEDNVKNFIKATGIQKIIFSGGGDIDSKLYGGKNIEGAQYAPSRENTEKALIKYAIKTRTPALGICRGSQFINVFFGGKIIQNLKRSLLDSIGHINTTHKIILTDIRIKKTVRQKNISVNSYHNDGFTENELGKNLKIFAKSTDGIIEGYYHSNLPIVGIMWHPERRKRFSEFDYELTKYFINKK